MVIFPEKGSKVDFSCVTPVWTHSFYIPCCNDWDHRMARVGTQRYRAGETQKCIR